MKNLIIKSFAVVILLSVSSLNIVSAALEEIDPSQVNFGNDPNASTDIINIGGCCNTGGGSSDPASVPVFGGDPATVPVYGVGSSANYLDYGIYSNYGTGYNSGYSTGYSGSYYTTPVTTYTPINWGSYVSPYSGYYGSGSGTSNVVNSNNIYDNSQANTYIDNSTCIGNNNCNVTNTNIVTNTTNVNGNNNNVNTNASGSTGPIQSCPTGYSLNNGNCSQIPSTPSYNPYPTYTNPVYNTTPVYIPSQNIYNNSPIVNTTPIYTTPVYVNNTPVYTNPIITTPIYNNVNYYNYPMVSITASPINVIAGGSTNITWNSSYATYCQGSGDWSGNPTLSGTRYVPNIGRSMTFTITCYNNNGQSAKDSVTVYVSAQNNYNIASYNKAVTTLPTKVTNNSAVCNGVAISNNNISNTGYFELREYDTNGVPVRVINTNSANIGNATSNYYSAPVTGLKANTKYTCRAIVNNIKGIMKGEELSFRTTGATVKYVNHTPAPKTKSTKVKQSATVCTDNSGNKMTLNEGDKMLNISVNKLSEGVEAGKSNYYTVTIRNDGGVDISNVDISLSLDQDLRLINSNDWKSGANGVYKNTIATIYKGGEKTYIVKTEVNKSVNVGSSLISTISATYEMNSNKGVLRDEVSAYVTDTVIGNSTITSSTGLTPLGAEKATETGKKTKTFGQFIDSLGLEDWVIILIIITACVFLIRNIYQGLKK